MLPDGDYQRHQPRLQPNRLALIDLDLSAVLNTGHHSVQSGDSAGGGAAAPEPQGAPAAPRVSAQFYSAYTFDNLVRAYAVIPGSDGHQHIIVSSGEQLGLWTVTKDKLTPVWNKNGGRQVRDMARRHNLLAWGGNLGRLRCLDLSRSEVLSKSYLTSEIYGRNVHEPIGSLRWRPDAGATTVSMTTDIGSLKLYDIRQK